MIIRSEALRVDRLIDFSLRTKDKARGTKSFFAIDIMGYNEGASYDLFKELFLFGVFTEVKEKRYNGDKTIIYEFHLDKCDKFIGSFNHVKNIYTWIDNNIKPITGYLNDSIYEKKEIDSLRSKYVRR